MAPPPAPTTPEPPQDWPERIQSVVDLIPSVPGLPGFSLSTLLPTPSSFDPAINSLRQAAATYSVMGGHIARPLESLRWQGNDATGFRAKFTDDRQPELVARGNDLTDLADALERAKKKLADEIAWIRDKIIAAVTVFLDAVQAAFEAAKSAALEALNDAKDVLTNAASAAGHAVSSAGHLIKAGFDQLTPWGGDGGDELRRAVEEAQGAVDAAQRAYDAVVDFTLNWEFGPIGTLPVGICRAWYDVDEYMAGKSGSDEAYGVTYTKAGRFS